MSNSVLKRKASDNFASNDSFEGVSYAPFRSNLALESEVSIVQISRINVEHTNSGPPPKKRKGANGELFMENGAAPAKKWKGSIGQLLMEKMGHKEGKGLGKHEQGIKEPIKATPVRGRAGLGTEHSAIESGSLDSKYDWTPEREADYVSAREFIKWIECSESQPIAPEDVEDWIEYGPREMKPIEEYEKDQEFFCDFEIIRNINRYKSALDGLSDQQVTQGRTLSNPFEGIGKGIFQNRAAMKMANMDSRFNFMFTKSDVEAKREHQQYKNGDEDEEDEDEEEELGKDEILYFADVCAGPGGFSEYVLYKKKWHAHGFGMTLKSGVDWKLDNFVVASTETFEVHYGDSKFDDGDIYKPQNLKAFHEHIMSRTNGQGTHFIMADGGFSVEGRENYQEILSKRLYLCQFLCALMNIRPGGHFTCKLFDCFTPFTVGLIYLMYRCFKKICIFKPNTSRPANSERYLICKSKNESSKSVEKYLNQINCQLDDIEKDESYKFSDIVSIVPLDVMKKDGKFYDYICWSNNYFGERQILFLSKMKMFALDPKLPNPFYGTLNYQLFKDWQIPQDKFYRETVKRGRMSKLEGVLDALERKSPPLEQHSLYVHRPELLKSEKSLEFIYSFKACVLTGPDPTGNVRPSDTTGDRGLILVISKSNWYFKNTERPNSRFEVFDESLIVNMPYFTLVYGELTWELQGEGTGRKKVRSVHLIDGLFLGGEDIRGETLEIRSKILAAFVQSIQNSSPSKSVRAQIRHRPLYDLSEVKSIVRNLETKEGKNQSRLVLCHKIDDRKYISPTGLLFVATVNLEEYLRCKSSGTKKFYFYHKKRGETTYEAPPESKLKVGEFYKNSLFWPWESFARNFINGHSTSPEMTFMNHLLTFINSRIK